MTAVSDTSLVIYLKTTETCNLNCLHCFTNGINGSKIFWDHVKVSDWLSRLHKEKPQTPHVHCEFHGGEPFLVSVESMRYTYNHCKDLWPSMSWGMTSNLTFKLTEEKINFIMGPLNKRIATSWDPDIRFANPKQYDLWRKNVEILVGLGVDIKLNISVTKGTVSMDPIDLIDWVKGLGIRELSLERLTSNGSALKNPQIFPKNLEQDLWFLKMHEQTTEHDARRWVYNEFLENVYSKFEKGLTGQGTFCRDCEEKLFTLNADGTIAGCPNSAPENYFGHIDDKIQDLMINPQRINNIACERSRDPRCYECEVFQYCNSDCHQLGWDGDICGAPKSLMLNLSNINTKRKYKIFSIKEI